MTENTNVSGFSFGDALRALSEGRKVARRGWNGKGMYLMLQVPDEHSKMKQPYIYINPGLSNLVPWTIAQPDVLQSDWYVVEDPIV